jgi:hypothetical protein
LQRTRHIGREKGREGKGRERKANNKLLGHHGETGRKSQPQMSMISRLTDECE